MSNRFYEASQSTLDELASYHTRGTFDDLLSDYEGPFRGTYEVVERFERDGKLWARFRHYYYQHLIDIERDEGFMGQLIAVPAEEAQRFALEEKAKQQNQKDMTD